MKFDLKSNKYIVLKDGNNIFLIIGSIVVMIALILLGTSKLWLPDDREVMTYNKEEVYTFAMMDITLPQKVYYDKEKGILEFEFTEKHMSDNDKFNINYAFSAPEYDELPNEVIFGNLINDDDTGTTKTRKVLLQVRVPENFYYITVTLKQPDNTTKAIDIDYRTVEEKTLDYKGQDYLKNREENKRLE